MSASRAFGLVLGLFLLAGAACAQDTAGSVPAYEGWTWRTRLLPASLAADTMPDTAQAPPDDWIGRDKAYHAVGSFALTLAAHAALIAGGADAAEALPIAAGATLFLGLMKETADRARPAAPHFSWRDLAADAAGVLATVALVAAF